MNHTTLERDHRRCFAAPGACTGYAVRGPRGGTLGRVREVYVNERYEPEYLEVGVGFLGLRTALLPVLEVDVDDGRRVLTLR